MTEGRAEPDDEAPPVAGTDGDVGAPLPGAEVTAAEPTTVEPTTAGMSPADVHPTPPSDEPAPEPVSVGWNTGVQ